MTSTDLLLLKRYYAALSPTTPSLIPCPPFPDARTLSLPETQSLLVGELLNDMEVTGASSAWKKVFWRRVVKGIEEGYELRRQDPAEKVTVEDEVRFAPFVSDSCELTLVLYCRRFARRSLNKSCSFCRAAWNLQLLQPARARIIGVVLTS